MKNEFYRISILDLDMILSHSESYGTMPGIDDFTRGKNPIYVLYEDKNISLYIEKRTKYED